MGAEAWRAGGARRLSAFCFSVRQRRTHLGITTRLAIEARAHGDDSGVARNAAATLGVERCKRAKLFDMDVRRHANGQVGRQRIWWGLGWRAHCQREKQWGQERSACVCVCVTGKQQGKGEEMGLPNGSQAEARKSGVCHR